MYLRRSTLRNTSSSAPYTPNPRKHRYLSACTHALMTPEVRINHRLSAQTPSEDSKKEFLDVVKTLYTHQEAKIIQEHARTFIGKFKRVKLNPQITRPPSFWKGAHFFQELSKFGQE